MQLGHNKSCSCVHDGETNEALACRRTSWAICWWKPERSVAWSMLWLPSNLPGFPRVFWWLLVSRIGEHKVGGYIAYVSFEDSFTNTVSGFAVCCHQSVIQCVKSDDYNKQISNQKHFLKTYMCMIYIYIYRCTLHACLSVRHSVVVRTHQLAVEKSSSKSWTQLTLTDVKEVLIVDSCYVDWVLIVLAYTTLV